ncbi:MAG: ferredoxin-thioredoxin reductase catalytic domain-containing protein [Desulfovibrionaceae bacterium]
MDAKTLYEQLKKLQEPKGYFFNDDLARMTMPLMESLLENKARYGYMACPCRLANGTQEDDRDIICPCVYREPDVREYGACFCGLYVSRDWLDGKIERQVVPERRPPEKIKF